MWIHCICEQACVPQSSLAPGHWRSDCVLVKPLKGFCAALPEAPGLVGASGCHSNAWSQLSSEVPATKLFNPESWRGAGWLCGVLILQLFLLQSPWLQLPCTVCCTPPYFILAFFLLHSLFPPPFSKYLAWRCMHALLSHFLPYHSMPPEFGEWAKKAACGLT